PDQRLEDPLLETTLGVQRVFVHAARGGERVLERPFRLTLVRVLVSTRYLEECIGVHAGLQSGCLRLSNLEHLTTALQLFRRGFGRTVGGRGARPVRTLTLDAHGGLC